MDKIQSEKTMIVGLAIGSMLDTHLSLMQNLLSEEDFNELRSKIGQCMGVIHFEILDPIWKSNPDLLPEFMDGSYKLNDTFQKKASEMCKQFHANLSGE